MIGLAAYLALVVTLPALALGHQGEAFPPLRWWRWARARKGRARGCAPTGEPQRASELPRDLRDAPDPARARTADPHRPAWSQP